MKKILFLFVLLSLVSCTRTDDTDFYFINEKFVIVSTNESSGLTQDKFHKPIYVKKWLIKRVADSTYYRELSSYSEPYEFTITNELWYNKNVGDTLYFKYIGKKFFFKIKK